VLASLVVVGACGGSGETDDRADVVSTTPTVTVTTSGPDVDAVTETASTEPESSTPTSESASSDETTEPDRDREERSDDAKPPTQDSSPSMPPVVDPDNVYSETMVGKLGTSVRDDLELVYVPTNDAATVVVIDQASFTVVDEYLVGNLAQHVTPSWDLETLYANASGWNQLVPIDPDTGTAGEPIPVDAPYNLYFTPDGAHAVVMAERRNRIDYYDPSSWERDFSIDTPCDGPNHADWTLDGSDFWVTCEFSSQLLHLTTDGEVLRVIDVPGGKPQDIRLLPDGSALYLADMANRRVLVLDPATGDTLHEIPVDEHPHGIYPSRDASVFYVSNRVSGTVSVIDWRTHEVIDTWVIPGGGSPDMGGVNANGTVLWLSGRFHDEVYAFDTTTGELLARVPVAGGPHGLTVWPQPGRYSLGHTGNLR
jgi:YVTN family beta-propeller protein